MPRGLVAGALAISGVFDLEPLRHAPFLRSDLRLDREAVRRLSPAGFAPPPGPLYAVVGADESEEFLRQNALISDAWGRAVVPVCEEVPGQHHMSVLFDLAEPGARLHRHALALLGIAAGEVRTGSLR